LKAVGGKIESGRKEETSRKGVFSERGIRERGGQA